MRKALMSMILAATVMSPIAAQAQDGHGRDRGGRSARNQNENDGDRGDRGGRAERRQQEAQPALAPAPQPEQQQQQQQQVVQRQRGDGDGGGRNRGGDGNRGERRAGNDQPSVYPQAWQGDPNSPHLRRYQELERRNQQQGGRDRNWRDDRNDRGDRDGRNWRNDRRGDNDGRNWRNGDNRRNWRNDWNRSWRDDRRYDWQRWRYSNRNAFHIGRYYSPYRGYGYNRFDIGFFLEPLFFGRNYWIGDPWQYRLPAAPPGTQWVRYYNDVLLVDVYSGEVIDAIYDFFW